MVTKRNKFNPEREGQLLYNSINLKKMFSEKLYFDFTDILQIWEW